MHTEVTKHSPSLQRDAIHINEAYINQLPRQDNKVFPCIITCFLCLQITFQILSFQISNSTTTEVRLTKHSTKPHQDFPGMLTLLFHSYISYKQLMPSWSVFLYYFCSFQKVEFPVELDMYDLCSIELKQKIQASLQVTYVVQILIFQLCRAR